MGEFGDFKAADALRERDCMCYGDPDGPCGQHAHGGSHNNEFMDCVDAFYAGKNSDPKKKSFGSSVKGSGVWAGSGPAPFSPLSRIKKESVAENQNGGPGSGPPLLPFDERQKGGPGLEIGHF